MYHMAFDGYMIYEDGRFWRPILKLLKPFGGPSTSGNAVHVVMAHNLIEGGIVYHVLSFIAYLA